MLVLMVKIESQEHRLALVIGNAKYIPEGKQGELTNPENDARAMKEVLEKKLGFHKVIFRVNATLAEMATARKEFIDSIQQDRTIVLFYFSGHGVEESGKNYLLPIDYMPEYGVSTYSLGVSLLLQEIEASKPLVNMTILDACRTGTKGKKGLAPEQGGGSNTLIMYATSPGTIADDTPGNKNSVFTTALLKNIEKEGDMLKISTYITEEVAKATKGAQKPWVHI